MDKLFEKAVKLMAAAGGAVAGALGGWDALLRVLVCLMAADYLSGVLTALMGKSRKTEYGGLSSKAGAEGIARKGLMLLVVLCAALLLTTGMDALLTLDVLDEKPDSISQQYAHYCSKAATSSGVNSRTLPRGRSPRLSPASCRRCRYTTVMFRDAIIRRTW